MKIITLLLLALTLGVNTARTQTTLRPLAMRTAVQGGVADMVISPDSRTLAVSGYDDSVVFLIATASPHTIREVTIPRHARFREVSLAMTPDNSTLLIACEDTLSVVDLTTLQATRLPLPWTKEASCLTISPGGDTLLWLSDQSRVIRCDWRHNIIIDTMHVDVRDGTYGNLHRADRDRFAVSSDLREVVFMSAQDTVKRLDLDTKNFTTIGFGRSFDRICFSPLSDRIIASDMGLCYLLQDGAVTYLEGSNLLSQRARKSGKVLLAQGDSVLEFSLQDSSYAFVSRFSIGGYFRFNANKSVLSEDRTVLAMNDQSVYPNDWTTVAGNVYLVHRDDPAVTRVLEGGPITGAAWSPIARSYATATMEGDIAIHEYDDSIRIEVRKGTTAKGLSYSPNGHYIASALYTDPIDGLNFYDATVMRESDLSDTVEVLPFTLFPNYDVPQFSPRGDALLIGSYLVLDPKNWGAVTLNYRLRAFSPDGSKLVATTGDSLVSIGIPDPRVQLLFDRIRDVNDWRQLLFAPEPSQLMVRKAQTLRFMDAATGHGIDTIALPANLSNIALSPTRRMYAASSTDSMIYVWDAVSNGLIEAFKSPVGAFDEVTFSFDETQMLAWSGHRYVVFDAPQYRSVPSTRSMPPHEGFNVTWSVTGVMLDVKCNSTESGVVEVELADALGRVLCRGERAANGSGEVSLSLPVGHQPAGMYFLHVTQNGRSKVERVSLDSR